MAHDRIDWHSGVESFPPDLPDEAGGTHIGMYLAWAIRRGLEGDLHKEDSGPALADVRERRITGRQFLIEQCDTKFWEEDLGDLGNEFTRSYYLGETKPSYADDYAECLAAGLPSIYHVEDTWENCDIIAARIDARFAGWNALRGK